MRRHGRTFFWTISTLAVLAGLISVTAEAGASDEELKAPVVVLRRAGSIVGTGFIVTPVGHLLTAAHVVKPADRAFLTFEAELPTKEKYRARVVELRESIDVAILELEDAKDLPVVVFGKSREFEEQLSKRLSEKKAAAPLEELRSIGHTDTTGKDRPFTPRLLPVRTFDEYSLIETGTTLAAGNSGGPVFDADGAVVGMVVRGGDAGAAYILPIHNAAGFLRTLNFEIRSGRLVHMPPEIVRILGFESVDEAKRHTQWLAMRGEWYAWVSPSTALSAQTPRGTKAERTQKLMLFYRPSSMGQRTLAKHVWARVYPITKADQFDFVSAFESNDYFRTEFDIAEKPGGGYQFTSASFVADLDKHVKDRYQTRVTDLEGLLIELRIGTQDQTMIISSIRLFVRLPLGQR